MIIPARDEQATIGPVVSALRTALVDGAPLVDELVVIDSDSVDATADAARAAGARVITSAAIRPDLGSYPGKGEAIWKSQFVTSGDLLVFVDADLTHFGPHFVTGLLGPLLADPQVLLVKGFYDRILDLGDDPTPDGGRVTELVARPLLNLWWPDLARVVQPLAGEWAVRRRVLESVWIPTGYGVELATLLDTCSIAGLDAVAQVDLGSRAHRHQAVHDLGVMAAELLVVADRRRTAASTEEGSPGAATAVLREPDEPTLSQFRRTGPGGVGQWHVRPVPIAERPPAAGVAAPGQTGAHGGANGAAHGAVHIEERAC